MVRLGRSAALLARPFCPVSYFRRYFIRRRRRRSRPRLMNFSTARTQQSRSTYLLCILSAVLCNNLSCIFYPFPLLYFFFSFSLSIRFAPPADDLMTWLTRSVSRSPLRGYRDDPTLSVNTIMLQTYYYECSTYTYARF